MRGGIQGVSSAPPPRRIAVLLTGNPLIARGGSGAYLTGFAEALRRAGRELHLVCARPLSPAAGWGRMQADYLAPYASIRMRRALRLGPRLAARSPRSWLARLRRGSAPDEPLFAPPRGDEIAWAAEALNALAPDLVVSNYFGGSAVFPHLAPGTPTAILSHDVFKLKRKSAAAAGVTLGWPERYDADEIEAFRAADIVLAIKAEEADYIRAVAPGAAAVLFPITVPVPEAPPPASAGPICLLVGSRSHTNDDGLRWLLDEVWPKVTAARPDARLRVVGRMAEAVPKPWPAGAEPVGFVEDLDAEHAAAAVALAPLRFGSGVKLKGVEALAQGLPLVATASGAEGIAPAPPPALRVADDPAAFAAAVAEAVAEPDPAAARAAARALARQRFSLEVAAARAVAQLDDAVAALGAAGRVATAR